MTAKLSTSTFALATIFFLTPAIAADLGGGSKDTPVYGDSHAPINWTGLYIGGRFGYGNANHELSVEQYHGAYCFDKSGDDDVGTQPDDTFYPSGGNKVAVPAEGCDAEEGFVPVDAESREVASLDGLNSSGITGGAQLGFDKQFGRFVVGVFGSYDLSSMDTTASIGDVDLTLIEKGDEWSVGARAGFLLHPRVLAYVLAAYTETEWTFGDATTGEKDVTFSGVTVGGGLEYALTQNVFLGLEGTHTFYGEETILDSGTDEGCTVCRGEKLNDEIGETKILGTLKIKLNADLGSSFGL